MPGFTRWAACLGLAAAVPARAQTSLLYINIFELVCDGREASVEIDESVVQAGQGDTVHVPAFFRTITGAVSVTWSLADRQSAEIAPLNVQTLQAHSSRRLGGAELEADGGLCEDVFISDGRSPVDLPDTWGEAREAFRASCEEDGSENASACLLSEGSTFAGQPSGEEAFRPSAAFCEGLSRQYLARQGAVSLQARRLKSSSGGTAAGGKSMAGRWERDAGSSVGGYGFASSRMGGMYPRGYATTPYGYSGLGAVAPMRSPGKAVVIGAVAGSVAGLGLMRFYARSGRDYQSCGRTTDGCGWDLQGEDMVRDDMMNYGFIPSEMQWPLRLKVSALSGAAMPSSGLCYGQGWNSTGMDMFFALVPADAEEEVDAAAFSGVFVAFALCCCAYCGYTRCSKKAKLYKRWQVLKAQREAAAPLINATVLTGGPTLNMVGQLGDGDTYWPGPPRYQLQISSDGTITGHLTPLGSRAHPVVGRVTEEGDGAWLLFTHAHGDDQFERSIEVRARITPAGYGEAQLTGEYIGCKPNSCRPIASIVAGNLYLQKEAPTPTGVATVVLGHVVESDADDEKCA